VDEDPVTGSAHCSIIPYWSKRLGKDDLICRQISARGGSLICRNNGDRVVMSGKCALFMEGFIYPMGK
jgi:predicted PhzF superfamily epimerase YddE/YHI9